MRTGKVAIQLARIRYTILSRQQPGGAKKAAADPVYWASHGIGWLKRRRRWWHLCPGIEVAMRRELRLERSRCLTCTIALPLCFDRSTPCRRRHFVHLRLFVHSNPPLKERNKDACAVLPVVRYSYVVICSSSKRNSYRDHLPLFTTIYVLLPCFQCSPKIFLWQHWHVTESISVYTLGNKRWDEFPSLFFPE